MAGELLHVYTNGNDWVVASTRADAAMALAEHQGEANDEDELKLLPDDSELTLAVDAGGDICPVEDGVATLTMPCAAWVLKEGRGYLGSEDT